MTTRPFARYSKPGALGAPGLEPLRALLALFVYFAAASSSSARTVCVALTRLRRDSSVSA
ncbi:hypothetical protein QFZ60_001713 [Arthrobacter sp. B2I5]|nr:hypothetical protein [Arthrobacter sp. B2I5]